MDSILTVKNLTVKFHDHTAIEHVTFELSKGDFLGVIGPNGAGKTVLLRALLGEVPQQGSVEWQKGVRIGYVPQHLDLDRYLALTLEDFLHLKLSILRIPETDLKRALSMVGLPKETLAKSLNVLSGGQLQRGLIAFALLGTPDVLLFDEPTASIDTPGEERIYELLHRLQDEYGLTIILVAHELDLVSHYANKILCLNRQMICFGGPSQALEPAVLERMYGGAHKTHIHALH